MKTHFSAGLAGANFIGELNRTFHARDVIIIFSSQYLTPTSPSLALSITNLRHQCKVRRP